MPDSTRGLTARETMMMGPVDMPTYDYACTACGNNWEAEQRITADPLDTCPKCGEKTAKRQISGGAAFILKGGGWYSDLYSSAGSKKPDTAAPASTGSTPAAGSTPSAPAAPAAPSTSSPSTPSSGSGSSSSG